MTDIKRYDMWKDFNGNSYMRELSDGDYVSFEDHEESLLDIQEDLKELQTKYDELKKLYLES